jgi:hypothetical protein
MVASNGGVQTRREMFLAELSGAALAVMALHGVRGSFVDLEVRLWNRLERSLDRLASDPMAIQEGWEHRVAALVEAAYGAALEQGAGGPFLDLELALWKEFRRVVRTNRFVAARGPMHLSGFLALR